MAQMVITTSVSGGGVAASVTTTLTGDSLNTIVTEIPNTTDNEVILSVGFDEIVGYWISSPVIMTIDTNSTSVPDDTIVLAANVPVFWSAGNPTGQITADIVTNIFVSNSSGGAADLTILVLQDPTP